jgi:lipopolysaccharide transport system ATP-binding protein
MSDVVIKVENIWKEYHLGVVSHHSMAKDLQSWWARMHGKEDPNAPVGTTGQSLKSFNRSTSSTPRNQSADADRFWALRDINFEVKQGERVGIIGRNGAGKSTLLKILSNVTTPTRGQVTYKGRIASLLEVGTGFHPELTGRENIFLNGAILGMTKNDIRRKFDEIVDFSGVDKFIDTPVKRYSSGMYVRLAFAVAAHLEPEILIIDEVLAVGDAEFQKKCLGKMEDVAKEGRTIIFVSHNMIAVKQLCSHGVLLESGTVKIDGEISKVVDTYLNSGKEQTGEISWLSPESAPGDSMVRLKAVRIVCNDQVTGDVDIDKDFRIEADYLNLEPNGRRLVSFHIINAMGIMVLSSANMPSACVTPDSWYTRPYPKGEFRTSCTIPGMLLNDGLHSISIYINIAGATDIILFVKDVITFNVNDTGLMRQEYMGPWLGTVRPRLDWRTIQLS